ncbi:MAG: hypothetical protein ACLS7S_08175 [Blautia wexlerae]|nr:hypothetical protein [Ruminococcus sp.]
MQIAGMIFQTHSNPQDYIFTFRSIF